MDTTPPPHPLPARPTITGVVLTRDGDRLIRQCISSLAFCDAILVVDSGSKDNTIQTARTLGATVLENAWTGFADQFTFAAAQVQTDWLFILDQDEICTPELAAAIRSHTQDADAGRIAAVAFAVGRKSWYFDRFMTHGGWYPDFILRVFRTGRVTFWQDAHIHYRPDGPSSRIDAGEIIHYPYTGFTHQLTKLNVYADQGAEVLRRSGKGGGVMAGIVHALARFFRIYILKRGFLDGRAGFLIAAHGSFYAFLKYVRVLDANWGEPFDHK